MKHVQIILHESCPMNCKFCYYNKDLNPKLKSIDPNQYNEYDVINFIGGELIYNYYPTYIEELTNIIKPFTTLNKQIIISTNLVKIDLLIELLNKLDYPNISIGTSYDYTGRSINHLNNNIELLRSYYPNIRIYCNMILTKSLLKNYKDSDFYNYDSIFFMPLEESNNNREFYNNEHISIDQAIDFLINRGIKNSNDYINRDCTHYVQFNNKLDRSKNNCNHFKHLSIDNKCLLCELDKRGTNI